jgi:hypothetical protein
MRRWAIWGWLVLALPVPASAGTLWLSLPPGDAAAPCTLPQVSRAIEERHPGLVVVPGPPPGGEGFRAAIEASNERWELVVEGAEVPRTLRRELPAPGSDCEALSQTAGLMVARFLEDLPRLGGAATLDPLERPAAAPTIPIDLLADLGLGASPGVASARPQLTLGLAVRRASNQLWLGADLELPETAAIDATHDFAFVQGRVELAVEHGWDLGPGLLWTGGAASARLTHVAAQGPLLFHSAATTFATAEFGLRAGYEVPLGSSWALGGRLTGRVAAQTTTSGVDGYAAQVSTRRFDGDLSAVLSRTLF